MSKNINEIGCKWRYNDVFCTYVELDVHQSNFHQGMSKYDSPHYAKVMTRNDGTHYIRYKRKTWNID